MAEVPVALYSIVEPSMDFVVVMHPLVIVWACEEELPVEATVEEMPVLLCVEDWNGLDVEINPVETMVVLLTVDPVLVVCKEVPLPDWTELR